MHILRAFFDTHRHMNDSQQENSGGFGNGAMASNALPAQNMAGGNSAQMEAEALEAEDQRRDAIVEHAEKLMVEIYAAPPVLDATAAAEQIEEVEDALSKRADELVQAISQYREALSSISQATEASKTEAKEEENKDQEEGKALAKRAESLVEAFRQEESPP